MKLKMLFTAIAALLIAGTAGAQDKDPKRLQEAQNRVENMARYVKMDEATTAKVSEAMYKYVVVSRELAKKKKEMTPEDYKAASSADYQKWRKETNALLTKEQIAGYNQWLKIPTKERYKKPVQ